MGIKRLGRKRLHAIEKLGILKDISASEAMKKAIVSATQHRQGQKVTTDIVLDLGSSTAGLLSKANPAENSGIGLTVAPSSGRAEICQITDPVFGIVTSVETICLEAITDGTLADFDLKLGTIASGGTLGAQPAAAAVVKENIGTLGQHETVAYDAEDLKNKYLFLTSGAVATQKATATIDLGGTDFDASKIVSGITTVRLIKSDGQKHDFVADDTVPWDTKDYTASGVNKPNSFGIKKSVGSGTPEATTAQRVAHAISHAINDNANFSTDVGTSGVSTGGANNNLAEDNATSIVVTHAATTVNNNNTNFLIDDPQNASGISVGAFTGGIDDGVAMSGKLLIRVTGFVEFDDL